MDWQELIVGIAVIAAAAFAIWSLWPARSRWQLLARLDARLLAAGGAAAGGEAGGAGRGAGTGAPAALRRYVVAPLLARAGRARGCGSCDSGPASSSLRRKPR